MTVKDMKEILAKYPDDMEIWRMCNVGHAMYKVRMSCEEYPSDDTDDDGNRVLMF